MRPVKNLQGYAKRYGAQYEERSFETVLIGVRRRHVLKWLERYGARRVLEVGCGLEPLFGHYEQFDAWGIVEPIAEFASRARERAAGNAAIKIWEGYLEEQTEAIDSERFDFIIVSGLVHEVPDPLRLLSAVHSLCSEATVVHLNVPNALSFHRLLAREMRLIEDVFEPSEMDRAFGHYSRFDRDQFLELLRQAGFRVLEAGTYFIKPFTHDQMDAILRTGVFPPSLIEGLDRMTRYMPEHGCELFANVRQA